MFGTYLLKWYLILKELHSINTRNVLWKYLPSVEWYSCISRTSLPVVLCLFFKKFCVLNVFLNRSLVGFPFLLLFFFLFLKQFSNSVILLANVWTPLVALDVYDRNNGIHFIWCQVENATLLPVMMNNLNMKNKS